METEVHLNNNNKNAVGSRLSPAYDDQLRNQMWHCIEHFLNFQVTE